MKESKSKLHTEDNIPTYQEIELGFEKAIKIREEIDTTKLYSQDKELRSQHATKFFSHIIGLVNTHKDVYPNDEGLLEFLMATALSMFPVNK